MNFTKFTQLTLLRIGSSIATLAILKYTLFKLSFKEVSTYYFLQILITFVGLFLINPLGQYLNRHLLSWKKSQILKRYLKLYNFYVLIASIIGGSLGAILMRLQNINDVHPILVGIILCFHIYCLTWSTSITGFGNIIGFSKEVAKINLISTIINTLLTIIILEVYNSFISLLLTSIITNILTRILIEKRINLSNDLGDNAAPLQLKAEYHQATSFVLPLMASTLMIWFNVNGYRLILQEKINIEAIGYLTITIGFAGQFWNLLDSLISQQSQTIILQSLDNNREIDSLKTFFATIIPFYILALLILVFSSRLLWILIINNEYDHLFVYFELAIFIEFLRVLNGFLTNDSLIKKSYKSQQIPQIITSILLILICTYFVQEISLIFFLLFFAIYFVQLVINLRITQNTVPFVKSVSPKTTLLLVIYIITIFIASSKPRKIELIDIFIIIAQAIIVLTAVRVTLKNQSTTNFFRE